VSEELDPRWVGAAIQREHWHFYSQLYRRYGIVLAPGEFSMIRRSILNGDALLVEKRKGFEAIYWIRIPSAHERIYVLAAGGKPVTAWPATKRLNSIRRALSAGRESAS
jgi:hypothetical protein